MNPQQKEFARMIWRGYTKAEILEETTISTTGYARIIREIKEIMGVKTLKEIAANYEQFTEK